MQFNPRPRLADNAATGSAAAQGQHSGERHGLASNRPRGWRRNPGRRRLDKVVHAWNDFQSSRTRDAVYGYLEAVFAIVAHYKVRRRTSKLLRQASKFANLPFDKEADPFTAVIRCTSDGNADNKTISKWARGLRYAARYKVPPTQLRMFMKEVGGVNACADRYTASLQGGAR